MILRIDRAWLLDAARLFVPGDPDVTDYGTFQAAVARHGDEIMEQLVYAEPHHRAAALMHQLIRVPGVEWGSELLGTVVARAYLTASGVNVRVDPKEAVDLARRIGEGLDVRETAGVIRTWVVA